MRAKTKNYLNNRDILEEIHKSKNTYSIFLLETDHQFDIILPNLERINIRTLAQAKRNRAERIQRRLYEAALADGQKVKANDFLQDWKKIDKHDLVIRINTYDHIPLDPTRKKNPKTVADHHEKCNFPAFQHYRFDENTELQLVGKSHWTGGLSNGHFCIDHGNFTDKLAIMFTKLCDRYGTKYNWRNYTYNDEMRGQALVHLCNVGLQFDENKSQNPFAWYTAVITNSFTRVLNLEKRNQSVRDDILEINGMTPSYTRQNENQNQIASPDKK